jgi:hypothetical protein
MQRREIWIIVLVVVLIGAIWTIHSFIDSQVATDAAPIERSDQQNTAPNAPSERNPAAGTNGTQANP